MANQPSSLYVHIPFCTHICGYCDFCKLLYRSDWAKEYLPALCEEISSFPCSKLKTIYVGGGTPTALEDGDFEHLLAFLQPLLDKDYEFTVEANPESLTPAKVALMVKYGVNRVSIGVESSSPRLLTMMERHHGFKQVQKCVQNLKEAGVFNINLDLMYALPEETMDELDEDIDALLSLDVPHLSTYSLILEEGTIFAHKKVEEANQDDQAEMYEHILSRLREAGYERYEVSNFAKSGHESKHNCVYWRNEEYFGAGLGASGYVNRVRYTNTSSLKKYLENSNKRDEEIFVELDEEVLYFLLTNLRLAEGFDEAQFESRFKQNFIAMFPGAKKHFDAGLLQKNNGRIAATDKGMLLLDGILRDLI